LRLGKHLAYYQNGGGGPTDDKPEVVASPAARIKNVF